MAEAPRVDETDFRILSEMFTGDRDFFRPDRALLADVAKRVGLHRNTVTARVRRLTAASVFLPMTANLEPGCFDLHGGMEFLHIPPERRLESARESLFHLDGVKGIAAYLDCWALLMYAEDESVYRSRLEVAKAVTGATRADRVTGTWDYPPREPISYSRLDAELIVELLRNPRTPMADIARRTGRGKRTLERRFARLQREGAVYMTPGTYTGASGVVIGHAVVHLDRTAHRPEVVSRVLSIATNTLIRVLTPLGPLSLFVYASSTSRLEAVQARLYQVPGVDRVTFRVLTGMWHNPRFPEWASRLLSRNTRVR